MKQQSYTQKPERHDQRDAAVLSPRQSQREIARRKADDPPVPRMTADVRINRLMRIEERIETQANETLLAAVMTPYLKANGTLEGIPEYDEASPAKKRMYERICLDATECQKEAPIYLSMAERQVNSIRNAKAKRADAPRMLVAALIVRSSEREEYEEIEEDEV